MKDFTGFKQKRIWLVLLLPFIEFTGAVAQYTLTPHGLLVDIGTKQVELAVAKKGAFRLSVDYSGIPTVIPSVFIDPSDTTQASFTVVSEPPLYGIMTSYGKLMVNSTTKKWMLYDSNGSPLIIAGTYISMSTIQTFSYNAGSKAVLYGSGNYTTKNLIKNSSNSQVSNGMVDIPYMWSSAGFCALGVTPDDNIPATWNNSNSTVTWRYNGKAADLYLWPAKTLYDATSGLANLTGKPKLPPKWAFGYLQCRWGWENRAYIENTLNKFRSLKLPVDAFIYDFEWYTGSPDYSLSKNGAVGFSDFSFNPNLFSEPTKQIAAYKTKGVKFIGIRKPRLGNSANLTMARSKGWLKYPLTDSRDIDFSKDSLRDWYIAQHKPLMDAGVDAWWNDEGESYYSCYYWWNKTQVDLLAKNRPNMRHFSLNRAFSPGNQRMGYSTWTGDIQSTWQSLNNTPADILNWGLSGMYYGTCDIGGFGATDPPRELVVRWFEAGVFLPIMRAHSNIGTTPRFPWLWGTDSEAAIRKALNLRYQLIPFIYSLGHEAYKTGAPIMRPLIMEFPNDSLVANMTDEWLLGKGLLAAPILNTGGSRRVYLPADLWYDFHTNDIIQGPSKISVTKALDEIPVYVRAGTILPIGPVLQYTEQDTVTPLEIRIYPGRDGSFTMTEDDGKSYDYIKDSLRTTMYTWTDSTNTLSWKVDGQYSDNKVFKTIKVVLRGEVKTAILGLEGSLVFDGASLPAFNPAPGTYDSSQNITLSAGNGDVYYTIDGSTPSKESTKYSQPITIPSGTLATIKAFVSSAGTDGPVVSANYLIKGNCFGEGKIIMEKWTGLSGALTVSSIPVNQAPTSTKELTNVFEIPSNTGQLYYGVRIRGLLRAPMTGDYKFFIAGDDYVELWLSPDSLSANKVKIAYHNGWTNSREWTVYPEQESKVIPLIGCQNYYIEALLKQSAGGDNLAVRWVTPENADEVIPCRYLSTVSSPTSLNNVPKQSSLSLYPNPANEQVNVDWGSAVNGKTYITVYDLLGNAVSNKIITVEKDYQLKVSSLQTGTYFVNVSNKNLNITQKFAISR